MSNVSEKTFSSAQLFYSDHLDIKVTDQQLQEIAKKSFSTHQSQFGSWAHRASQFCLIPSRKSLQFISYGFQSRPGANKDKVPAVQTRPFGILRGALGLIGLALSSAIVLLTAPVHLIALASFKNRPVIGYIDNSGSLTTAPEKSELTEKSPLHIRTHNLGFVIETMGITGDLRPVCDRANELADSILDDPNPPDVMFFQETFHEDGMRLLSDRIKEKYPYIIHSVLPTVTGFNSGAYIASKYPLKEVEFHRLEHFLGPECLTPRGLLKVKIETKKGPVNLYSTHTQALIGKERAEVRKKQLEQIGSIMNRDFDNDAIPQVLVGDLNTSTVTAWGEDNLDPKNPEKKVQDTLDNYFDDLFLRDHDKVTGVRSKGQSEYLEEDNRKMKVASLQEPSGTWYVGPFAEPRGFVGSNIMKHRERDRQTEGYKTEKRSEIQLEEKSSWGTPQWRVSQQANTARFDYILVPKRKEKSLDGRVEIRRVIVPEGAQSASTDHLPVDAKIWLPEDK